jgi:tetratricopeptide (TPR) repeat protein
LISVCLEDSIVADYQRLRHRRSLREAEGYLELIMGFDTVWPPARKVRTCLAQRALDLLAGLPNTSSERVRTLYLKGLAFRAMYRYREAIPYLKLVVDLEPDSVPVWLELGWCYKRCGRLDLAIQALENAIDVEPDTAIVHYNLACYWSLAGSTQLALQYLAQSLEIDPEFRGMIPGEPDFDPIRDLPEFRALAESIS